MLRVLALAHLHLAAPADPAAAADRVEVDAEPARGVEHGRARGRTRPAPRRREDDESVVGSRPRPPSAGPRGRRAGPPSPPRSPSPLPGDPRRAVRVVPHHHVGGPDRLPHLGVQRARDRRGEARRDRHRQEGGVEPGPVRQPEADVRGAAGGVDSELLAQPPHEPEHLPPGGAHRADRHHERVDDDVLPRDPVIGGARDDLRARPRSGRPDPRRCPSRRSRSRRPRRRAARRAGARAPSARPRR